MAKFQPAINIWTLPESEYQRIQPGQWVYAGEPANLGRFYGSNGRTHVVAWLGNARQWRKSEGGMPGYFAALRCYARGLSR